MVLVDALLHVRGTLLAKECPSRRPTTAHASKGACAASLDCMKPVPDNIRDLTHTSP